MAVDSTAYRPSGLLTSVSVTKAIAMPTLNAAVSCTGPVENSSLFAYHISQRFSTFDDLVRNAESFLPETFEELAQEHRDGDACSNLFLVGWHEGDDRPAAYAIDLWTDGYSR